LPYYELTERIHEFHTVNQRIWSRCNLYDENDQAKKELNLLTEKEKEKYKDWQ